MPQPNQVPLITPFHYLWNVGSSSEGKVVTGALTVKVDTDGDGIFDTTDVDDDNDGF